MSDRVLVTGVSGFLGSHCALELLRAGYSVRGSIRDESRADGLCKMLADHGVDLKKFELTTASLTNAEDWFDAVKDCTAIFHVASPVPTVQPIDPNEVIEPAVQGTLNVLRAADQQGIRRVVLTSSIAAIVGTERISRSYNAEDWSDPDDPEMVPYAISKTAAERAAWAFCKKHDIKLTTVNPGMILGPALEADYGSSLELITKLMRREVPLLPKMGFDIVDVRDVASLHRLALENTDSVGQRLIAANGFRRFQEVAAILKQDFPDYPIPQRSMPNWLTHLTRYFIKEIGSVINELDVEKRVDNRPALALGWKPRSPEEAILSAAQTLIRFKQV